MSFSEIISLALGAILVENFILVKFLGICPFLGVSQKSDSALGMGLAVTFVMTLSSAATWAVNHWLLLPNDLGYLRTVAFILVIAALVQLVEMFLQKCIPALHRSLGIYLPLITTNCAVLGVALLANDHNFGFGETVLYGLTAALGFTLAIVLFSSIRDRLAFAECPEAFEGLPIALVSAGLLAMAFMGFSGLKI